MKLRERSSSISRTSPITNWSWHVVAARCRESCRRPDSAEAEEYLQRTHRLLEKLVAEFPAVPSFREVMAANHRRRGELFLRTNRPAEAEAAYRQELAICEALATDFASWPQYREHMADSAWRLGKFLLKANRADEAELLLQTALKAMERVVADAPVKRIFADDWPANM